MQWAWMAVYDWPDVMGMKCSTYQSGSIWCISQTYLLHFFCLFYLTNYKSYVYYKSRSELKWRCKISFTSELPNKMEIHIIHFEKCNKKKYIIKSLHSLSTTNKFVAGKRATSYLLIPSWLHQVPYHA